MKIGLTTLHDYNFGSALQCYATQKYLSDNYCECILINKSGPKNKIKALSNIGLSTSSAIIRNPNGTKAIVKQVLAQRSGSLLLSKKSIKEIKRFNRLFIKQENFDKKSLYEIGKSKDFQFFFSGSDQVWNGSRTDNYDLYFLRFAPKEKRIAWAPSFGGNSIEKYNIKRYAKYISEYNVLSCREESGRKIIHDLTGKDATKLCDPIFLIEADEWRKVYEKNIIIYPETPYILLFFIDKVSDETIEKIQKFQCLTGRDVYSFGYSYDAFKKISKWRHIDGSPLDFVGLIDKASCVITDSFHATAFSLLMHTPFYTYTRNYTHKQNQSTRITSLLEKANLSNRFDSNCMDLEDTCSFEKADILFEEEREVADIYLNKLLQRKNKGISTKNNIDLIKNKFDCCGCMACADACPKDAIKKIVQDGAIYPFINQNKCIQCGNCIRICALKKDRTINNYKLAANIGFYKNNELYLQSASGGIFAGIARQFLSDGGVVYGACMELNESHKLTNHHIRIDNINDLQKILNSKYVQSDTDGIFKDVYDQLINGKKVLFSGTSCQVASLLSFLKITYENLYTIDLICHGVPGIEFFNEYLNFIEEKKKSQVEKVTFRTKNIDGKNTISKKVYSLSLSLSNGKQVQIPMRNSAYYRMYMAQAGYRESCYACRYANVNKPADITLGDFYSEEHSIDVSDLTDNVNQFLSSILVKSEKGKELLQKTSGLCLKEVDAKVIAEEHNNLQQASLPSPIGEKYMSMYKKGGFKDVQNYIDKRNKIADVAKFILR